MVAFCPLHATPTVGICMTYRHYYALHDSLSLKPQHHEIIILVLVLFGYKVAITFHIPLIVLYTNKYTQIQN